MVKKLNAECSSLSNFWNMNSKLGLCSGKNEKKTTLKMNVVIGSTQNKRATDYEAKFWIKHDISS